MAIGDRAGEELRRVLDSIPQSIFHIGELIAETIRNRTRNLNISAQGGAFVSYSEKYAKRAGQVGMPVDLTVTGSLLDSIKVLDGEGVQFDPRGVGSPFRGQPTNRGQFIAAKDIEISVGPTGQHSTSGMTNESLMLIHQQGRGRVPSRPVMGLTEQEADELTQVFARNLYQPNSTTEAQTLSIRLG